MKVIGLTGGIASGKSTASRYLLQNGLPVLDADLMAREVVLPGMPALAEIAAAFGDQVILITGELDRKALGAIVFSDAQALSRLNRIMHPRILERLDDALEAIKESKTYSAVIIDAALLLEANWDVIVDDVWVMLSDANNQCQRLVARSGYSESEAQRIIAHQMPQEEKMVRARVWIDNNKSIADLYHQLDELILTIT